MPKTKTGPFTPFLLSLILSSLLLTGCATIRVSNQSDSPATAVVHIPDRASPIVRTLDNGSALTVTSAFSGLYSVDVVPPDHSSGYMQSLGTNLLPLVQRGDQLSPSELVELEARLARIPEDLNALATGGIHCEGYAGPFEEVEVSITSSGAGTSFDVSCGSSDVLNVVTWLVNLIKGDWIR